MSMTADASLVNKRKVMDSVVMLIHVQLMPMMILMVMDLVIVMIHVQMTQKMMQMQMACGVM